MNNFIHGLHGFFKIMDILLGHIVVIYLRHPTCMIWLTLSIIGLWFLKHRPLFTRNFLICSPRLNLGTFLGTFIHTNTGHFYVNMLIFIPAALYVDVVGKEVFCRMFGPQKYIYYVFFGLTVSYLNALLTGIYCIVFKKEICGASGIALMLSFLDLFYHISDIGGVLIIKLSLICMLLISEFISRNDKSISHVCHFLGMSSGAAIAIFLNCKEL